MHIDPQLADEFEQDGRVWLRDALPKDELAFLDNVVAIEARPGQRIDIDYKNAAAFSLSSALVRAVQVIDPKTKPLRIVGFNKSENSNWTLPWHQDRIIAVKAREDAAGFDNWTRKAGVWHCEPPIELLHQMLFVRVRLDDTVESNGAMQIALGSHKCGFVSAIQASEAASRYPEEICEARRGDILILKMLTLHRSKPSQTGASRRAIRIDFAPFDLPSPLEWP